MTWSPDTIKALRARLVLTQEQFAHKLGVTMGAVVRWETGRSAPSPLACKMLEVAALESVT